MEMDTARDVEPQSAPTSEVLDGLNDLLQLDHDALGAYEIAIEKLEDRDHADQIAGFRRDHERHIRELNEVIAELGGTPVNEPHATGPFKQALQSLGALAGDKGVLVAWRTNELQVRTKYDSYASKANHWPPHIKRLIDQNALDEERHYQWVVQVLQSMGLGSGEGLASDLATGVRERLNTLDIGGKARDVADTVREKAADLTGAVREKAVDLGGTVRERASDLGESARLRVADGIEGAANRLDRLAPEPEEDGGAKARVGAAAHRVAGGMENTADYLRRADAATVQADFERQIRESPVKSLLVLFAAGFVIGRILR